MRIIYKQNNSSSSDSAFSAVNITDCYFKELRQDKDRHITIKKRHCHTEYEIHIIFSGSQHYCIEGEHYHLDENQFIIISPSKIHQVMETSPNMLKYSITFNSDIQLDKPFYMGTLTPEITGSINYIASESNNQMVFSSVLIENRVFEIVISLLRLIGYKKVCREIPSSSVDYRITLAKKFITDNIEQDLSVSDVSAYCYLSPKQLTRIFINSEGISPGKYIIREKMKKIREFIIEDNLTLKQISDKFSFNNEYYFNTAFKKHFGMPPSLYRKMYIK